MSREIRIQDFMTGRIKCLEKQNNVDAQRVVVRASDMLTNAPH